MIFYIKKRDGQRLRVLLSDEDADLAVRTWHMAGGKGGVGKYAARREALGTVYLHRIVAQRMGLIPDVVPDAGKQGHWRFSVDHANGAKLDNRRENLRLRDRPQQMANTNDGLRSTNRSGYRGVSQIAKEAARGRPSWMAYVQVNYRSKSLGMYATAEDAAAARRVWDDTHLV